MNEELHTTTIQSLILKTLLSRKIISPVKLGEINGHTIRIDGIADCNVSYHIECNNPKDIVMNSKVFGYMSEDIRKMTIEIIKDIILISGMTESSAHSWLEGQLHKIGTEKNE
ncbi:MAG: hypothetical protein QM579_02880 [Desulfovibrio sp.]|uniref:hypothetical protein n=1 Tax=Desulfovibrio sp. TaxID=885 RepID=UPI0039E31949